MCDVSICTVLLWLVDFFGACFVYVIDYLFFAAVVGSIAILDENVRTVEFKTFASISLIILYFRA